MVRESRPLISTGVATGTSAPVFGRRIEAAAWEGATTTRSIVSPSMRSGSTARRAPEPRTGAEPGWKDSSICAMGVTPAIGFLAKAQAYASAPISFPLT